MAGAVLATCIVDTMNQIEELPRTRTHGLDFNYALWGARTRISLHNVPWNSDYRDVVRFANPAALDDWLLNDSGPQITIENATYAKFGQPIALNIPFNVAQRYNYIRAFNPAQPIEGDVDRAFYYFIGAPEYVNPSTTRFMVQLDVFQTFGYGITFGNCYIERGHVGIANMNQMNDNGREFLTIPEGLDVGGEYQIVSQWSQERATARNESPNAALTNMYSIMVTSTVKLNADPGDIKNPNLLSSDGSLLENLPNGAETYIFDTLQNFRDFLTAYSDKPYITSGIIAITAIPAIDWYGMKTTVTELAGVPVREVDPGSLTNRTTQVAPNWRNSVALGHDGRYANLKKLLTYPYCVLEMTAYTGTPLVIKPESWNDPHATVIEVPHFAQPGPRLLFYPYRYNAASPGPAPTTDMYGVVNDGGEFYDMATGIFNFPTFSIVNNGYMSFMASNAHSIAYQHQSADWSQTRALQGNDVTAGQATAGIGTSQNVNQQGINAANQQTNIANNAQMAHTMVNGMGGMVNGAVSGGRAGPAGAAAGLAAGAGSAAMSGVNTALDIAARNQSLGVSNSLSAGVNRAQTDQAGYMRDTNKAYGDYAAQGDYQNAIAGINAKVQDARLIQPTTSGQIGGDAFNLATYKWGYDLKLKMIAPSAMAMIGEYWLRYGYSVNRFGQMPTDFHVMEKFTYWKLRETYITSAACPEMFKQALRGIFEKGVTVWRNPGDIGTIDIGDNAPLEGVIL